MEILIQLHTSVWCIPSLHWKIAMVWRLVK
jgi:hypothetical protein